MVIYTNHICACLWLYLGKQMNCQSVCAPCSPAEEFTKETAKSCISANFDISECTKEEIYVSNYIVDQIRMGSTCVDSWTFQDD